MAISEYAKVSFVTTKSGRIPNSLKHTGALVVLSDISSNTNNRNSLWLRGNLISSGWGFSEKEYMDNAEWVFGKPYTYNSVFSPNTGMSYFVPSSDIEDIPYIKRNDDGDVVGCPQSIHMNLAYGILHTDDLVESTKTYLSDKIDNLDESTTYLTNQVGKIQDKIETYIAGKDDSLDKAVDMSYTYTKYWVDRIVGGAPEYLDSIKELNDWMQNNQDNAMQTISRLGYIDRYKVSIDDKSDNGYCYISTYQKYQVIDTTDASTRKIGHYTYTTYDNDGIPTSVTYDYTYYEPKIVDGGQISLKSSQISTKFKELPLDQLLERLILPYQYKKPSFVNIVINDNTDEWMESTIEYGEELDVEYIDVYIDTGDSKGVDMALECGGNTINTQHISDYKTKIYRPDGFNGFVFQPTIDTKDDLISYIDKQVKIVDNVKLSYQEAREEEYPQLVGLGIYDTENVYPSGEIEIEYPIYKRHNFKVYWGSSNDANSIRPFLSKNVKYIGKSTSGAMNLGIDDVSNQFVWVCIPTLLVVDNPNFKVVMRSYTSGIENDLVGINANGLDMRISDNTHNNGTIDYSVITVNNKAFKSFADKLIFEVIFN